MKVLMMLAVVAASMYAVTSEPSTTPAKGESKGLLDELVGGGGLLGGNLLDKLLGPNGLVANLVGGPTGATGLGGLLTGVGGLLHGLLAGLLGNASTSAGLLGALLGPTGALTPLLKNVLVNLIGPNGTLHTTVEGVLKKAGKSVGQALQRLLLRTTVINILRNLGLTNLIPLI